jgi:hypothetical protein
MVVSTPAARFTYEDYRNTPEDQRCELLDGDLVMTAAPNIAHQRVSSRLERASPRLWKRGVWERSLTLPRTWCCRIRT